MKKIIGFCVVAVGLISLQPAFSSGVEYPLGGNFETEEGTVEMWVTPTTKELAPPDDGKYHSVFSIFSTTNPGNWNIGTVWYRHGTQLGIKASMNSPKVPKGLTAMLPGKELPPWDQPGVHHFAFVWKGAQMSMYADGKRFSDKLQAIGLEGGLAPGQKILFGSEGKNSCEIILHAVRISSVAKTPEDLANAKPEAETVTLLLDKFDDPAVVEARKTNPQVIYSLGETVNGVINGPAHFVSEPAPGIALSPE